MVSVRIRDMVRVRVRVRQAFSRHEFLQAGILADKQFMLTG